MLSVRAGRHGRRGDRADQREPLRQRHRDLHLERRGGPPVPARREGRHDRHQRARSRCRWPTTPSAAGRTRCSATSTCTARRACRFYTRAKVVTSRWPERRGRVRRQLPLPDLEVTEPAPGNRRLRLGSCPDSWGVWFADDPLQTPWHRFLDELAEVGLRVAGAGAVRLPAHRRGAAGRRARPARAAGGRRHRCTGSAACTGPDDWRPSVAEHPQGGRAHRRARRREHLIFVPVPGYRDDTTGAYLEPAELDAGRVADDDPGRSDELGQVGRGGVRPAPAVPPARGQPRGDPGADRAVPGRHRPALRQPLPGHRPPGLPARGTTWPSSAATPTGSATCTSSRWTRRSWPRPSARASPSARPWPWAPAASRPRACRTSEAWSRRCRAVGRDLFVVVEQDMYPVDFDRPEADRPAHLRRTCAASASGIRGNR